MDASADILTNPIIMGNSESCQLRLYLGPDDGCILLEACIDDLLYKVIADLIFFNRFVSKFSSDSDYSVEKKDDGINIGIEFGGTFGLFEKLGDVLHVKNIKRTDPAPIDAPLEIRTPPSPRLADLEASTEGTFDLERRLFNPRWRFVGVEDHSIIESTKNLLKKPAAEEPKITGFTIVETLGASPFRALEHGKDWVWSEKLLKAGSINWDNARRRV